MIYLKQKLEIIDDLSSNTSGGKDLINLFVDSRFQESRCLQSRNSKRDLDRA